MELLEVRRTVSSPMQDPRVIGVIGKHPLQTCGSGATNLAYVCDHYAGAPHEDLGRYYLAPVPERQFPSELTALKDRTDLTIAEIEETCSTMERTHFYWKGPH